MRPLRAPYIFTGIFLITFFPLYAQNLDSTYFSSDSSAPAKRILEPDDETSYQLIELRLSLTDSTHWTSYQVELYRIARQSVARGQLAVASVLLEEILSQMTTDSTPASPRGSLPSGPPNQISEIRRKEIRVDSDWKFEKRFQAGFDLNKQDFSLITETGDSTIREQVNTPTSQFELALTHQKDLGNEWQIRNVTSYDDQNIRNSGLVGFLGAFRDRTIRLRLQDRIDYNLYQSNHDWSYFHHIFSSTLIYDGEKFETNAGFDLSTRNYSKEESSYPNFIAPTVHFDLNWIPGLRWMMNGNFYYDQKIHSTFDFNDYHQNQLGGFARYSWNWNHFMKGGIKYLSKNFQSSVDTATVSGPQTTPRYASNRYQEVHLEGEWSFPLVSFLTFRLLPSYGRREYEKQILLSPDYSQFQFEGNSMIRMTENWHLNLGWESEIRDHHTKNSANADEVKQENYRRTIYRLGLDITEIARYYVSVTYSFEKLRYPNASQTGGIGEISLHTDRDIQSISIFANWKIWDGIDLNAIVNLDDDRSASAADPNTSKSKLVSFQLQYSF